MTTNTSVPSDPTQRQKLKTMLVEMTKCLQNIDDEREQKKEIAKVIKDEFKIETKVINKLARTMYKHDYANLQAENEHFEHLYETLVGK